MLHWIQYIKGYVSIKVWGYSTERFLNLCGNHDILVWDIENHGDYYTMKVSVKGFFELKSLLRKTGTRASVLRRYGLPFFVPKMRKRKIFVIGLLVCLLFWIFTGFYIWDIKIEGNYSLTEDVLMDYLDSQGVHTAMKKKDLQIEEYELPNNDYSGQTETDAAEPENDAGSGKDIVAAKDGVIVYMITRKGVPQVAVGDTVEKGQILVSGAVPVYNEDATVRRYQYYEADADIMITYEKSISVQRQTAWQEKEYSGREKKILLLGFQDKEWNLSAGKVGYEIYDVSGEKKQVQLLDHLFLPVFYGVKYAREYSYVPKTHTEEEMQQIMEEEWNKILHEKGVQITEKNVTINKNREFWVLNARMQLMEEAIQTVPNTTEQVPVTESEEEVLTE